MFVIFDSCNVASGGKSVDAGLGQQAVKKSSDGAETGCVTVKKLNVLQLKPTLGKPQLKLLATVIFALNVCSFYLWKYL
jgi:hypothetical protein